MAELYLFQPFAIFTLSNSVSCIVKLNACYSRHASANMFPSVHSRHSIGGSIAKKFRPVELFLSHYCSYVSLHFRAVSLFVSHFKTTPYRFHNSCAPPVS